MLGLFDDYAMAQLQSRCSGGASNPAASVKVFEDKFSAEIASTFYERHIKPMVLDGKGLSAQVFEAVTVAEYVVCDPQPTAESSGVPPPFGCVLCGQMKRVFPKNGLVSFEVSHTHIAQTLPPMTHGVRFFCCASHACFITMVYDVTHFLNHFKRCRKRLLRSSSRLRRLKNWLAAAAPVSQRNRLTSGSQRPKRNIYHPWWKWSMVLGNFWKKCCTL